MSSAPQALLLLRTMLAANGGAVTKADMMGKVWPCLFGEDGNITVPIALLRKALGKRSDRLSRC